MRPSPAVPSRAAGLVFCAVALAALGGCAGAPPFATPPPLSSAVVADARIVSARARLECVTYARHETGIEIFGDAGTWWDRARGHYARGAAPRPGAVMVFAPYRGSLGHLAVVRRIVGPRVIVVDHADWLNDGNIHIGTPVADVSPKGDWSRVRVWYSPGVAWGLRSYAIDGFVYPSPLVADTLGASLDRG
jgi:hypothetical protein